MPLTVADVLALPVLAEGRPRVRVGGRGLEAPVRWVHISDLPDVAGLLRGGELVLSTGTRLADADLDGPGYLRSLREVGAAGLVVELGQALPALPEPLVSAARTLRFPLVELTRTVRFVAVTEAVHGRLLHEQYEQLTFSEQVHRSFAALTTGAGASTTSTGEVLARASSLLARTVVLEDLAHRPVEFRTSQERGDPLTDWAARSRRGLDREGWVTAPVGPVGQRWGRLVVPEPASDPERVQLVLERAADVLTILRLVSRQGQDVTAEATSALLRDLLGADRHTEQELRVRARALGLPVTQSRRVQPLAVHHRSTTAPLDLGPATRALQDAGLVGLVGPLQPGVLGVLVSVASEEEGQRAAGVLARELATSRGWPVTHAVLATAAAASSPSLAGAGEGLLEASHVAAVAASIPGREATAVARSADLGARSLLWSLRADPRVDAYVEGQLGALLQDGERGAAALDLLRHLLSSGGSMTRLAQATGANRPGLYARVRRLGDRLGRDLDDPEVRTSLHLAVLAHDLRQKPTV